MSKENRNPSANYYKKIVMFVACFGISFSDFSTVCVSLYQTMAGPFMVWVHFLRLELCFTLSHKAQLQLFCGRRFGKADWLTA